MIKEFLFYNASINYILDSENGNNAVICTFCW